MFRVGHVELGAFVVPKIKLFEMALQMLLRDTVIDACDPALETCEVAFNRVGVSLAADILVDRAIDRIMAEIAANVPILAGIVRHEHSVLVQLSNEDRPQRRGIDFGHMLSAETPITLDECKRNVVAHAADIFRIALGPMLVRFVASNIGLIGHNDFAVAAHRSRSRVQTRMPSRMRCVMNHAVL